MNESTTGVLKTVIVEGTLVFEDDGNDIDFKARYIIIRSGRFVIGSEQEPYSSNLKITMYGVKEDD